jgi:hypothetical protein
MMAPAEDGSTPARCPRCSGPLYRALPDEYCCLYCGEYVFATRRPPLGHARELAAPGATRLGRVPPSPAAA